MARRAQGLAYDSTIPGGSADAYEPDDEDFMDEAEREAAKALFTSAGRQRFSSAAEQREYLRLVRDLHKVQYHSWTASEVIALGLVAAGLGALVGLWWRKHRQAAATGTAHLGLDLLGAS